MGTHAILLEPEGRMTPWLSVIGIGEDGCAGLSPAASHLLREAELVVGGARHLKLAGDIAGETLAWPSPLADAFPAILAKRGRPVCVLASGDPFFYGIGSVLAEHVPPEEMVCHPAPSAFSLAAARLGWAMQDCALVSLHGRSFERILPHLQPGARTLALSWDETTPERLAKLLANRRMGRSRLTVLEALGGARERIRATMAEGFALTEIAALNIVAIEVVAERGAPILSLAAGLPDEFFEHDGQITKREIRAMTLSGLAPRKGELLWDIGAGSGSVGIEWMLRDPANRAIAIEAREERAARIARNALALGTPALQVVTGEAPAALDGLPRPDAAFIGGGGSDPVLLDAVWAALPSGGRLVVNGVTLEAQAELTRRHLQFGGDLVSINIARADAIGGFHGWRPAMPVVQWAVTKP
jgi:precorrin-6Y C5,15-methyltransferase (decarboxylating)